MRKKINDYYPEYLLKGFSLWYLERFVTVNFVTVF